jgi:short-subunit dehydrogenase
MMPVVVITGGSSGIGKSTAHELARRGCTVYELSRRDHPAEGVIHIATDVTNEASVANAIDTVMCREGRIDILINNAGSGISGAVEFTETQDVMDLFDVNFHGMVRVTKAVLPHMRKQGKGRVINVSSVAAIAPIPYQTYYSATKSAVMSYSLALANEVADFGITVATVLPGDIKSGFTGSRKKSDVGDEVYHGRISRSVSRMERDEQNGMSSEKAAIILSKIALSRKKKPVYVIGFGYQFLSLIIKLLPIALVNRIIKLLYAN